MLDTIKPSIHYYSNHHLFSFMFFSQFSSIFKFLPHKVRKQWLNTGANPYFCWNVYVSVSFFQHICNNHFSSLFCRLLFIFRMIACFLRTQDIIRSHRSVQTGRINHTNGYVLLLCSQTFKKTCEGELGSTVSRSFW